MGLLEDCEVEVRVSHSALLSLLMDLFLGVPAQHRESAAALLASAAKSKPILLPGGKSGRAGPWLEIRRVGRAVHGQAGWCELTLPPPRCLTSTEASPATLSFAFPNLGPHPATPLSPSSQEGPRGSGPGEQRRGEGTHGRVAAVRAGR